LRALAPGDVGEAVAAIHRRDVDARKGSWLEIWRGQMEVHSSLLSVVLADQSRGVDRSWLPAPFASAMKWRLIVFGKIAARPFPIRA